MKIAILGTRGIPNHYGGFEQYAELLSVYLVSQGWEVLVYNSSDHPYKETEYKGVKIKHVYDPERKWGTAGQFIYDLGCIWHSRKQNFDVIYQLGYTSSAIFNFLFSGKTKIVTNMDGLEWKRAKYSKMVQKFLKFSEWLVVKMSDHLVADSVGIKSYLDQKYKKKAFFSAYTADIPSVFDEKKLESFNLTKYNYDLLIARMEPENNIEMIIQGYLKSDTDKHLIVIGSIHMGYGQYLFQKYNSVKIHFHGAVFEKDRLDTLRYYARLYFHGHSVGGTNPSLLEAMACSCRIVAHNNEFNRGVLEQDALYFSSADDLTEHVNKAGKDLNFFTIPITKNIARVTNLYSEEAVFSRLKVKLMEWGGHNDEGHS
jgi:glycosyltransferase involved in cell wall biosynthesis